MRYVIILAAIPAVIWAAMPSSSPPVVAKAVTAEGVREQRQDENSFRRRFEPVAQMPAAIEVHYVRDGVVVDKAGTVEGPPVSPPSRQLRSARSAMRTMRIDICAKHNMRRVMVGKYRWR